MLVRIVSDYESLSSAASRAIAEEVRRNPALVLGLAGGSTPSGTYRELVRMHRQEGLDFSTVVFFSLDEYSPPDAPATGSFENFLKSHLLDHLNVPAKNVRLIRFPTDSEVDLHCRNFERAIEEAGGIDLQILGIGRNGHIAFNEPGSSFHSRTRLVRVNNPSRSAISLGIRDIMESKRILLLASGSEKAQILPKALSGYVTETVPASVLQNHKDLVVIADRAAAEYL